MRSVIYAGPEIAITIYLIFFNPFLQELMLGMEKKYLKHDFTSL